MQLVTTTTNLSVMMHDIAMQLEKLAVHLPSDVTKYRRYFDDRKLFQRSVRVYETAENVR